MKLDCVLTSVNENPQYLDFVPIFIKTWNKLYPGVDVKIILIAKNIPENLLLYKNNLIVFEPIENILTSFTAQFIRLLYPCILNYKNGVLITDMDILPMNKTYYTENIKSYENNKFIYYRENVCFNYKQIAMCYNVATPQIWKDIFKVNSLDDIIKNIKYINENNVIKSGHGNIGWCIDQKTLYYKVLDWDKITKGFVCLKEKQTQFKRLDRNTFEISNVNIRENITSGKYTDYHCYRPMSKYSKINWEIFDLLPKDNDYSKLKFIKSKLKSPIGDGLFDIFINTEENMLFKKIKQNSTINISHRESYRKIIYGIKNNPFLSEYIFEPEKIFIEDDGSYYSSYIKNGIRLYDINSNFKIDDTILDNLKKSIQDMKKKLNNYVKTSKLSGDWALHNLIYCLDTKKIYNVDLEGFYTYPLLHDNGNCDIKYCNERFDNLLDIIENKLENKRFDTCFVTFSTDNNYLKLSEVMIKSLSLFSKYPIILYCVNFDTAFFNKKYSNVFCKRIDLNEKDNIFLLKPAIIYDSIVNLGVKNGIYIESDDVATPYIDNLFNECSRIDKYPLCPIHPRDPNNQANIMKILNVPKKSIPYVHGHVVFTSNTQNFIKEWYDVCKKYIMSAASSDETILNVLLWKYSVTEYIHYIYDPFYKRLFDNKFEEKYGDSFNESKIYMYHGTKNVNIANDMLNKIIDKYDYKIN